LELPLPWEKGRKDLATPAKGDLFVPVFLNTPLTEGSRYEPAKGPRFELPGGTHLSAPSRAALDFPASLGFHGCIPSSKIKEEHLSFHMGGNGSPTLLVAVNRFERGAQEGRHLLLGFL
jgi:hypothetical protein